MKKINFKGLLSSRGKRNLIIITSVFLIGAAVYLNYHFFYDPVNSMGYGDGNMDDNYDEGGGSQTSGESENDYFTETALSRDQSRDEAMEVLQTVADSEEADEATKTNALAEISKIALNIQNEANIESLVKAKGFEECVAVISGDSVSVIVKSDNMNASQAAQICTIVYETTGILPSKVSIIEKQ